MVARAKTERLDVLVVQRGLVESREQARRCIMAGEVLVEGHPYYKAGHRIGCNAAIELKSRPRYVSRGGEKLEVAFAKLGLDVSGCLCLDVGASTGGFTDCLLQHGAAHVVAMDVGRGQIHERMRQDQRVTSVEQYNVRHLKEEDLPYHPSVATFDVSFISLKLVMPPVAAVLEPGGLMVTLIKPQFEAGKNQVERGGVVRDESVRLAVVNDIRIFGERELALVWEGYTVSPIQGPAGNVEYVALWRKESEREP